jgi:hypothetical protein
MRNRRFEIGFSYFCGNCEEELDGVPAGIRKVSGRPLCLRCSQIGEQEGWGKSTIVAAQKYEVATKKRGIVLILLLMAALSVTLFVVSAFFANGKGPR